MTYVIPLIILSALLLIFLIAIIVLFATGGEFKHLKLTNALTFQSFNFEKLRHRQNLLDRNT
jgi:hypothetical protein